MRKYCVYLIPLILVAAVCVRLFAQSASSPLSITSPPSNTGVTPGQTLPITVTRIANSGIQAVALHAFEWTPILQGSDPLTFTVTIPLDAPTGPVQVIAADMTLRKTLGLGVTSTPLVLNVQAPQVESLLLGAKNLQFSFAGQTDYLPSVIGVLTTGSRINLGNSTALTFVSADTSIAAVDPSRRVTALKPGKTTINATYTNTDNSTVSIPVPVIVNASSVRGDINSDGKVDNEDLAIIIGVLNSPANGPNDARDLNHDGVINALDARILTTLCTYPHCATHP